MMVIAALPVSFGGRVDAGFGFGTYFSRTVLMVMFGLVFSGRQ